MRILSATDDRVEWDKLWARLPVRQRDVHFTSAYGRVQEAAGGKAILAVSEDGRDFVAQPFLMQRINGSAFFDLKNLYGFGGPVSNVNSHVWGSVAYAGNAFRCRLSDWAKSAGVVSEYCTLHPLMAAHQLPLVVNDNVVFGKHVIVIEPLKKFDESQCERRVRKSLNKAAEAGVKVIDVGPMPYVFEGLYDQSMKRLGAKGRWRFDIKYWNAHRDQQVGARWFFVACEGIVRRALLTVSTGKTAYAHFLGSDGMCRGKGADELLYFTAAKVLARTCERFHLGGGLTERDDDSLLFFKSGFGGNKYQVGSYRRVFMPEVYDQLVNDFAGSDTSWFPAYRATEAAALISKKEAKHAVR